MCLILQDLTEVLQPSEGSSSSSSSLVLLSSGARLLRLRKASFLANLTESGLEHAKIIAVKNS